MTLTENQQGFSWNTHCILTRVALKSARVSRLNDAVAVARLEDFLASAREELSDLLNWHCGLIAKKSGLAGQCWPLSGEVRTPADFLEAMRLNPNVSFHYVRALLPEEVGHHVLHDQSREGPPGGSYVPTALGGLIPAIEVLSTFSDEPDWGMDQDLFPIGRFGYGPAPFGAATGMSSQAPFHMAFLHESRLLTTIVPRLRRNFMAERFQVFLALAKLAFKKGIDYWGWRFLAWAMHYLQDLTQPYHARAFPPSKTGMLGRLVLKPDFWTSSGAKRNYLRNRHVLFEAAVHFMLNRAAKNESDHPFLEALVRDGDAFQGTFDGVMKESARAPAYLAPQIDHVMVRAINDPRVEDVNYSLEEDPEARIDYSLAKAAAERPHVLQELVDLVCACLSQAGKATRYTVNLGIYGGNFFV